jgi:hypothetical protein
VLEEFSLRLQMMTWCVTYSEDIAQFAGCAMFGIVFQSPHTDTRFHLALASYACPRHCAFRSTFPFNASRPGASNSLLMPREGHHPGSIFALRIQEQANSACPIFKIPPAKVNGQETPLMHAALKRRKRWAMPAEFFEE